MEKEFVPARLRFWDHHGNRLLRPAVDKPFHINTGLADFIKDFAADDLFAMGEHLNRITHPLKWVE